MPHYRRGGKAPQILKRAVHVLKRALHVPYTQKSPTNIELTCVSKFWSLRLLSSHNIHSDHSLRTLWHDNSRSILLCHMAGNKRAVYSYWKEPIVSHNNIINDQPYITMSYGCIYNYAIWLVAVCIIMGNDRLFSVWIYSSFIWSVHWYIFILKRAYRFP